MKFDPDNLRQMMEQAIPHARELGLKVTTISAEGITVEVKQQSHFVGDPDSGIIHGGIITVLLDTVCGVSVYTALDRFAPMATLDLRIDYLRPANPKQIIYAHGHCYRTTRHVAFCRGLAYQDTMEHPIAHCSGCFMLSTAGEPIQASATQPDGSKP